MHPVGGWDINHFKFLIIVQVGNKSVLKQWGGSHIFSRAPRKGQCYLLFPWQSSYLNPSIPQRDMASYNYIRKILRGMPKMLLERCKEIVHFSASRASCSPAGAPTLPQHSLIPWAGLSGFSKLKVNVQKAGSEHSESSLRKRHL